MGDQKKPRRLRIGTQHFLWRLHRQRTRPAVETPGEAHGATVLSVFLEGRKNSGCRLCFAEDSSSQPYIRQRGVVHDMSHARTYNLNEPALVAKIIQHLVGNASWSPMDSRGRTIRDGYSVLRGVVGLAGML